MRRTTLMAVLVTTGALIAAGSLPRVDWSAAPAALANAARTAVPSWPVRIRRDLLPAGRPAAQRQPAAPAPAAPRSGMLLYAGLGAIAGLVLLALLARLLAMLRRDPRAQVYSLARRGRSAADIARSVHVPQDAVRTLLAPGSGARRPR